MCIVNVLKVVEKADARNKYPTDINFQKVDFNSHERCFLSSSAYILKCIIKFCIWDEYERANGLDGEWMKEWDNMSDSNNMAAKNERMEKTMWK